MFEVAVNATEALDQLFADFSAWIHNDVVHVRRRKPLRVAPGPGIRQMA
jgi:hypothetical protein